MERRFWWGLGILTVFLLSGLWISLVMDHVHEPVTRELEQARQAALRDEQTEALVLAEEAKAQWERSWKKIAALADHEPMEQIDGLFAQLESYAHAGDRAAFAACCGRLIQLVEAVGDSHTLTWWNLL